MKSKTKASAFANVVLEAGPAGLFLTLCLARYGLTDDSLLCLDAKPGTLKAGQADGLQPRTLEVLKSLGVASEILSEGCHMTEVAFWNPDEKGGIERTNFAPDVTVAARYRHEVTIHQGRIERILEENLGLYSKRRVVRSSHFLDFKIDPAGNATYPVHIDIEQETSTGERTQKTIRAKHLVGADGAHSRVRRAMGLKLEGETTDHIWGVADFVIDTDFPDIRRRCAIHSDVGSIMVIPREQIRNGDYLTRLYVQVMDDEVAPSADLGLERVKSSISSREKRAAITFEYIMEQAQRVLRPYKIGLKKGAVVDWWAAYQIGQRMAPEFSLKDAQGMERVFIVGDGKIVLLHQHETRANGEQLVTLTALKQAKV